MIGSPMYRSSRSAGLRRSVLNALPHRPTPQRHDSTSGARLAASPRAQHAADSGTSSVTHLRENIAAAELTLPDTALEALGPGVSIALNSSERD